MTASILSKYLLDYNHSMEEQKKIPRKLLTFWGNSNRRSYLSVYLSEHCRRFLKQQMSLICVGSKFTQVGRGRRIHGRRHGNSNITRFNGSYTVVLPSSRIISRVEC